MGPLNTLPKSCTIALAILRKQMAKKQTSANSEECSTTESGADSVAGDRSRIAILENEVAYWKALAEERARKLGPFRRFMTADRFAMLRYIHDEFGECKRKNWQHLWEVCLKKEPQF